MKWMVAMCRNKNVKDLAERIPHVHSHAKQSHVRAHAPAPQITKPATFASLFYPNKFTNVSHYNSRIGFFFVTAVNVGSGTTVM